MISVGSSILYKRFPLLEGKRPKGDIDFLIRQEDFDTKLDRIISKHELTSKTDKLVVLKSQKHIDNLTQDVVIYLGGVKAIV